MHELYKKIKAASDFFWGGVGFACLSLICLGIYLRSLDPSHTEHFSGKPMAMDGIIFYVSTGNQREFNLLVTVNGKHKKYFINNTYSTVDRKGLRDQVGQRIEFTAYGHTLATCTVNGKELCAQKCNNSDECKEIYYRVESLGVRDFSVGPWRSL